MNWLLQWLAINDLSLSEVINSALHNILSWHSADIKINLEKFPALKDEGFGCLYVVVCNYKPTAGHWRWILYDVWNVEVIVRWTV